MRARSIVPCITTDKIDDTKTFYQEHFGAQLEFDCGWYVTLKLGKAKGAPRVSFMQPEEGMIRFDGQGLMYNFEITAVDKLHDRLKAAGLEIVAPLEDHPWGDRGFAIRDPSGIVLYWYEAREPDAEFAGYFMES